MPARPRRSCAAGCLLLLLAGQCPSAGFAQPAGASDLSEEIERIRERIESTVRVDPRSPDLVEPMTALGLLYRQEGDTGLAAATLTSAIDIVRVYEGLRSLEQVPLLRHLIETYASAGDLASSWATEQELIELVYWNPDDLRTVPILRALGDDRINLLSRYTRGDQPEQIYLGCYYEAPLAPLKECTAGSRTAAAGNLLREAQRYYEDAIELLRAQRPDAVDEIDALERILLVTNAQYGQNMEPPSRGDYGRERLRLRLKQRIDDNAPLVDRVTARVDLADWELHYKQNRIAMELYRQAYDELASRDPGHPALTQIFSPPIPATVPPFHDNPFYTRQTDATIGHVDIEFEVTRYGRSRNLQLVRGSDAVSRADLRKIRHLIAGARFRPRFENGEPAQASTVRLRYFVNAGASAR